MVSHPFSMETLQNNWYEDRMDNRKKPAEGLIIREVDHSLAKIENDRFDVLTRIARTEKPASYAIPEDGFPAITESAQNIHYQDPREVKKNSKVDCDSYPRRELYGEKQDDMPVDITQHHNFQGLWESTKMASFDDAEKGNFIPDRNRAAGFRREMDKNAKPIRLCGEKFQKDVDPSMDSKVQRAWLGHDDPSLALQGQMHAKLPEKDNALSLPIGDGAQEVIMKNLEQRIKHGTGMLYKSKTDITKVI